MSDINLWCFSCLLYLFLTEPSNGSMSHLERNVQHPRSLRHITTPPPLPFFYCRFNDKVKHIKILTKDGCFYIAESRLFKTVLVRYFYTCCSIDCKHLDVILYSNRTTRASGNFGCTIFIGLRLFCFCDTLANWISYQANESSALMWLPNTGLGRILQAVLSEGRFQQSGHHPAGPLQGTVQWKQEH